jgi:hypothetical protein
MSKKQLFLNISICIAVISVVVVVLIKFVLPGKSWSEYKFQDFEKITVFDIEGKETKFSTMVSTSESTYCFLFNMEDCYSCIVKGIQDLESLKNSGKRAIAVMVHDYPDELKGWSGNFKFTPLYSIKRAEVYEHIIVPKLPVMLEIKDNEIESIRYIQL